MPSHPRTRIHSNTSAFIRIYCFLHRKRKIGAFVGMGWIGIISGVARDRFDPAYEVGVEKDSLRERERGVQMRRGVTCLLRRFTVRSVLHGCCSFHTMNERVVFSYAVSLCILSLQIFEVECDRNVYVWLLNGLEASSCLSFISS